MIKQMTVKEYNESRPQYFRGRVACLKLSNKTGKTAYMVAHGGHVYTVTTSPGSGDHVVYKVEQ